MKLADLFGAEERPKALRVLTFLGILRDKEELRFGFIFKPPHYIENIEPADELERGISKPRLPQTLLECITKGATSKASGIFPLGDRFNIARKLAKSIYVMHAAGWVHKKCVTLYDKKP